MTNLASLEPVAQGKVRDIFAVGDDRLLLVTSDRISTYDAVHPTPIPDKGAVLTGLSAFWFDRTEDVVPNHLVSYTEVPDEVRVVDLSLGGMRVVAPPWAAVGNVVSVELDGVGVRSLVVGLTPSASPDGEHHAHLAFGSLMPEAIGAVSRRLEGPVEVR